MSSAYSKVTLFDRILPYALSIFTTFSDLLEILPSSHLEQTRLGLLGDAHTNTYTHRWRDLPYALGSAYNPPTC
jgi:hypothetical protein